MKNRFLEYLALVPKGLSNPTQIIEGWINDAKLENGDLTPEQEHEILRRRAICESCPLNSILAKTSKEYFDLYGKHYETERKDLHCGICSCPIPKKTASLSSECGLNNYNDANPNNKQPLKWESFNK